MTPFRSRANVLVSIAPLVLCVADQGAGRDPLTDAAKIANALTAAPPAVSRNASVVEMNDDGRIKMLRKGTSDWTCVPDDPNTPGDPMCLDPNAVEWLHAYMTKGCHPIRWGSSTCSRAAGISATPTPSRPSQKMGSRRLRART